MQIPNIFCTPPWCRLPSTTTTTPTITTTTNPSSSSSPTTTTTPTNLSRTLSAQQQQQPTNIKTWYIILYAFAGGFTSATLFYSHPILEVLARDFHTTQAGVSTIPTLAQAGDAMGLLFILPLADFFGRRRFVLVLVGLSAAFWVGLCITQNLNAFFAFTFLSALFTGATQVLIPLVAELSTPEKRAFNLAIAAAGPTLGILIARILSGIVANYTSWRNVYWLSLGLQVTVLVLLWLFMPDYPAANPTKKRDVVTTYPKIIWSIVTLYPRYAVLVQAGLLSFCTFFTVGSFWTTLTFLLAGPPYMYSTLVIGLFGLVGASTMVLGPLYGKYIIQPIRQPLLSAIVGKTISLVGIVIGTYAGTHSVAGPIMQAFLLDAGLMVVQIANRMAIHDVEPKARNRVNTAFVAMLYLGNLTGTKAGNTVYEQYGGWIASGSLSVAVILFSYVIIAVRGPHEERWIGWRGGWGRNLKEKIVTVEEGGAVAIVEDEVKEKEMGKENEKEIMVGIK